VFAKLRLATILSVGAAALSLGSVAQAQTVTDVTVKDGAGNTIAENVRSFDENEAGSGLAVGFTPVIGSTFSFLYQANVVSFNDASGNTIVPTAGLNQSFSAGGYEFTIVANIQERVTSVTTAGGITTVTFEAVGGMASIFFDNAANGGAQSVTSTGVGFDDGHQVGLFDPAKASKLAVDGIPVAVGVGVAGGGDGLGENVLGADAGDYVDGEWQRRTPRWTR